MSFINIRHEPIINQSFEADKKADSRKVFKENLKTQPSDWHYRTKEIVYNENRNCFRTQEFEEIDWSNSIVMIGCSNVYGTGVAADETISYNLEQILNTPVVNLGIPGSSIDLSCWNSLILHNNYPKPKAIVHIWPFLTRFTYKRFSNNRYVTVLGHQYTLKLVELNWPDRMALYMEADRSLWKEKVPYIETTFCPDLAMRLGITKLNKIDYARDLKHPGPLSTKLAASIIAEKLGDFYV